MMSLMQDTAFGLIKRKPDPIEMVFIAKVHTAEDIAEDTMNEEDENVESTVLEEIQDLKDYMYDLSDILHQKLELGAMPKKKKPIMLSMTAHMK